MKTNEKYYEVVVVGGGLVGSVVALILAQARFRVLVIDLTPPTLGKDDASPDLRVSAISCTSVALLRRIGVWQRIGEKFCRPYRRLETWEWLSSTVTFDAAFLGLPELGFMVENRRLHQALWQKFADCDTLTMRCPATLDAMTHVGGRWRLTLNNGSRIASLLVVGADGAQSWVRRQSGIVASGWQYRQSCLLISAKIEGTQQDVTWQEFHPTGPRAFLPLYDQWASLVWYDTIARIRELNKLSLKDLEREITVAFPARLGPVTIHGTASFPLMRWHTSDYLKPGLALIGDAAHTIHPLAGQGANLGFRDAETLAEVLINARSRSEPWETLAVLQRYKLRRRGDNLLMQTAMDAFHNIFSSNLPALILARNLGLMLAQRAGSIKQSVLRYALGL
ncbi:3-demethoxyubiquinol 3-hydroxylase [Sodalis endosymbiont of Henestaris halophilus]|uniref:3-demethoxyubiquinol 3-hydroxylase n=1 Tax=Sodalis endosymbiont of Henestaris halophilus TaxID=1929246 RepID=UPI000BBF5EDA|nr:3-demethoxyubiquinol 3-hydroxylase [Sodalis endosymbiont of Henestaris halophilus]SNC59017.1 2-octaprenyl-3-methyl-6-methoxy-1,4-benzoquinol hydroxylase [Sodalis endosymbiont of Henestaris halophilus]